MRLLVQFWAGSHPNGWDFSKVHCSARFAAASQRRSAVASSLASSTARNRSALQESVLFGAVVLIPPMEAKQIERGPAELLLIERVLAGEKDLFHDLIRPYERGAFLMAYSVLRNRDDAEEVVQQSMLKIFSHLAELAERDKFKQWAMRVIENEAKMWRRKRRQHLYEPIDQNSQEGFEERPFRPRQFADWRDLPSDVVEQKEVREAIGKALADLPEMYREIFVLRDMQHLDTAETSKILGIGESAVKTRLPGA